MKTIECLDALRRVRRSVVLFAVATLAACGGGGDGVTAPPPGPALPKAFQGAAAISAENPSGLPVREAQIAIDAAGNAIAVWEQSDGVRENAWAIRFNASAGQWGTPQLIETDDTGEVFRPQIAMAPDGNALAVWEQFDGTRWNAWANRYDVARDKWGEPELLETDNAGDADYQQIAMDAKGNAIVVWEQDDGTRYNIWANHFDASTGQWGVAQLLETDNKGDASYAQIAMDANGNAMAVWEQDDGVRDNAWANRFDANTGQWGKAQLIEANDAGDADELQVAMAPNGDAIAVWSQRGTTARSVWTNRYDKAIGAWGVPQLLETDDVGSADYPQIAIDANGNATAVWEQYDGTRYNAWANRFIASTGQWGTAQLLESDNFGDASEPQVAVDASGNAIAVWTQENGDGADDNAVASRFDASTGQWGTPQLLETESEYAYQVQIAMNANGNAVVVWEQTAPGPTGGRIFANVFR